MDIIREPHLVKTRKPHQCHGCMRIVPKGEQMESGTYKDDYIYTIRTCDRCLMFIDLVPEYVDEFSEDEMTEGWIRDHDNYSKFIEGFKS